MGLYRTRVFPFLVAQLERQNDALSALRVRLLEAAQGHVIEVGSGTGANFFCYPDTITSLTTIEPNPGMNKRARELLRHLEFPVDSREGSGEALPLRDASFDTAVTTFTLGCVPDPEVVLSELKRVLKPGGRLLFLEHAPAEADSTRSWQQRLSPLVSALFDGYRLDRAVDGLVAATGFEIERKNVATVAGWPAVVGRVWLGAARCQ